MFSHGRPELTDSDCWQIDWSYVFHREDIAKQRAKTLDFAKRCHWRSPHHPDILAHSRCPITTFDFECVQWILFVHSLRALEKAGVKWTPQGRIVKWPRKGQINHMGVGEAQRLLMDMVECLPSIIRETRMDNAELALAEFGLEMPAEVA